MFIEKWKDTAFGTDYGSDFKNFLEEIPKKILTLKDVYEHCNLKKFFDQPDLLEQETQNSIQLPNPGFEQFVPYEDAVIALVAVVVESEANGSVDLTKAYGSKILTFKVSKEELLTLKQALIHIYDNPDKFILFELCNDVERKETLAEIKEILSELDNCIEKK